MKSNFQNTSRREFLRRFSLGSAAVATGFGFPNLSLAQTAASSMPQKQIGFALCGLGSLSNGQIAPALQKTKFCKLTGLITGHPAKAERWKAQYNIPDKNIYNYDTMEKMTDNPDIDVVYVVTPNGLHAEHTIKAAKAGKHVLCEKPMEVSPEKCQQMIDACKAANRLLAIGYRLHFEPNNLECVRLAREKAFGSLNLIQAEYGFRIGNPTQWRLNRALSGGGPLMDVGIYALQAARYVSGEEPVSVTAMQANNNPAKFKDIEESIAWELKFPSGVIASCNTTYNFNGFDRMRAFADNGWFELAPAFGYGGIRGRLSRGTWPAFPPMDQFAAEMDDFAQCILNNQPTRVPGEEGLRDLKIMTAIYEAAKTGKTVSLA